MKKSTGVSTNPADGQSASAQIDARINAFDDWRGKTLARIRAIIHKAIPEVVEEVKWRGVPVWSFEGILCTGETYKSAVKMTFAHGAALDDPAGLFNSSLEGNTRRAIDWHEGDRIDERALRALLRAAATYNVGRSAERAARVRKGASESKENKATKATKATKAR
ncbi:DUF1801 domain-containing protein [Pseudoxanthomonas dokdonensis]|uniref:YdhG-like domain-containing protein n=1 Tax=Pseudoxanthomonas dokdonensis TaxID=344882 RepID=A0A0R0CQE5_9GAMM|nr:DUF1801 domain-containing protein [Pseudoxanthomonas dokdonensis]KRG68199.1 hypothetical protein ABB29_14235 [Pseudoxanthomonas dokdonensis]